MTLDDVVFVETIDGPDGRAALVSGVEGSWRPSGRTVPRQFIADFIGGAPLSTAMEQLHLPLKIGSAQ
jgi:hypothetical protein